MVDCGCGSDQFNCQQKSRMKYEESSVDIANLPEQHFTFKYKVEI